MKVNFWHVSIFGLVSFIIGFAIGGYSLFQISKETIKKYDGQQVPLPCNDFSRYSGGQDNWGDEIPATTAGRLTYQGYINTFSGAVTAGAYPYNAAVGFRSFFISKKIIDQIFSDHTAANGIVCFLAKTSAADTRCSIIVDYATSAHTEFNNLDPNSNNSDIFICTQPQAYCPPNCGIGSYMK